MFISRSRFKAGQKMAAGVVCSRSASDTITSLISSAGFTHHHSHRLHKTFVIHCQHYNICSSTRRLNHFFLIHNRKQRLIRDDFPSGFASFLKRKTSFQEQVLLSDYSLGWESVWQEICHGRWPCTVAPSLPCVRRPGHRCRTQVQDMSETTPSQQRKVRG